MKRELCRHRKTDPLCSASLITRPETSRCCPCAPPGSPTTRASSCQTRSRRPLTGCSAGSRRCRASSRAGPPFRVPAARARAAATGAAGRSSGCATAPAGPVAGGGWTSTTAAAVAGRRRCLLRQLSWLNLGLHSGYELKRPCPLSMSGRRDRL